MNYYDQTNTFSIVVEWRDTKVDLNSVSWVRFNCRLSLMYGLYRTEGSSDEEASVCIPSQHRQMSVYCRLSIGLSVESSIHAKSQVEHIVILHLASHPIERPMSNSIDFRDDLSLLVSNAGTSPGLHLNPFVIQYHTTC